jgi:hypothetical protein
VESILNDAPTSAPADEFGPEYDLWLDTVAWEARMQDALDGAEHQPQSTPISDSDLAAAGLPVG